MHTTCETYFEQILSLYSGSVDQTTTTTGLGCHPTTTPPAGKNPFALINTGNLEERLPLTSVQRQEEFTMDAACATRASFVNTNMA